jgi:hypothetical protein
VEEYSREELLEETNRGYAALRGNPAAWQVELEERQAWEATLLDGMELGESDGELFETNPDSEH